MNIKIRDTEYALSTSLRVAYMVQGQHNHDTYIHVFQNIGDMVLEDQVGILYAAFVCANPEQAKFISRNDFFNEFLDNYTLQEMFDMLKNITEGILGTDVATVPDNMTEANSGNASTVQQ
jgi:hypothetical protein